MSGRHPGTADEARGAPRHGTAHTDTDRTAAAADQASPLRVIHRHTRLFTVAALGLGVMAYALAAFAIAAGAVRLALGLAVWKIRKAELSLV